MRYWNYRTALGLILGEGFDGSYQKKLRDILLWGPFNIVQYLKDDLSSGKIGPLVAALLASNINDVQKHFLAHFLIRERPEGWYQPVFEYMNLLHRNSFYLWELSGAVNSELKLGFTTDGEKHQLKHLAEVVVAKHIEGPRKRGTDLKSLSPGEAISTQNRLPIDKIRAAARRQSLGAEGKQVAQQGPSSDSGKAAADGAPTGALEG